MDTTTQQKELLAYMRNHPEGLNSYFATYGMGIKQAPARIGELREQGYKIVSVRIKGERSVNWVLQSKSTYVKPEVVKLPQRYKVDYENAIMTPITEEEYQNLGKPVQQSLL